MKKLLILCLLLAATGAVAQNNNEANPPDNQQLVLNNTNVYGYNEPVNTDQQINPQVQVQQQVQTQNFTPFRGNVFNTGNNPPDRQNQQKYGQSIQISSGGGGGYSGSSGKVAQHKSKGSIAYKIKKAVDKMKTGYKPRGHYSHKSRVRKCHTF